MDESQKKLTLVPIIILFILLTLTFGCGGKKSFSSSSSTDGGDSSTLVGVSPNGNPGGSVGTVDTGGFWISALAPGNGFTVVTRADSAYADYCEIDAGDNDNILNCIVDVEENDLHTQGLILQYNVPGSMCEYLVRSPYWYYDRSVGVGPTELRIVRTFDASDNYSGVQCSVNGGALGACNSSLSDELIVDTVDETNADITCRYDCCIGDHDYIVEADHTASGGALDVDVQERSWGDDYSDCVGGAGKTSWSAFTEAGYPASVITDITSSGLNTTHELKAPNDNLRASNMELANFYTPADHSHTGFVSATVSTAPYCVAPIDDISGDSIASGNAAYTFYCLDRAFEIRNIINVYIRDWDTKAEFEDYVDTDGVSGTPDQPTDLEGVGCVGIPGIGGMCDDFYDFDDLVNITNGGLYDTSTPSAREAFFPNEEDDN